MKLRPILILLGGGAVLVGCAQQRQAPPPPRPEPAPLPRPTPPPPPAAADWRDIPLTRGAWAYSSQSGGTQALFGPPASEAAFIVRCDRASRQVSLAREGAGNANLMTIRTSAVSRNLPVTARTEPLPYVTATVAARDPLLDSIAFSRGRFTVELAGTPMLVLPAWPEPARVVEDCRG